MDVKTMTKIVQVVNGEDDDPRGSMTCSGR